MGSMIDLFKKFQKFWQRKFYYWDLDADKKKIHVVSEVACGKWIQSGSAQGQIAGSCAHSNKHVSFTVALNPLNKWAILSFLSRTLVQENNYLALWCFSLSLSLFISYWFRLFVFITRYCFIVWLSYFLWNYRCVKYSNSSKMANSWSFWIIRDIVLYCKFAVVT